MKLLWTSSLLALAGCVLALGPTHAQADATGLEDAARAAVKEAWERQAQPTDTSALTRIEIHAVQRRNRLAPGVYLVHAFAETSWWKHSEHYLLLMRAADAVPPEGDRRNTFEVLYRYSGGQGGQGVEYRLGDLGAGDHRSTEGGQVGHVALEISDHGSLDDDTAVTHTILVLHLPASDRFAEVFRELTSYQPPSAHGYRSTVGFRPAEGPMKDVAVNTELLKDGQTVDRVESVFVWQDSAYAGVMPLPEAWRAELPAGVEQQAPVEEGADEPAEPRANSTTGDTHE